MKLDLPRTAALAVAVFAASCQPGANPDVSPYLPPRPQHRVHPSFLEERPFDCATLAMSVNHYVKVGEKAALEDLRLRARQENQDRFLKTRVAWITRILYGTSGRELRGPHFGALHLPYLSMPAEKWPLYPLAESGRSFFVMSEGYFLGGAAEPISDYIDYCVRNGRFRRNGVAVPTSEQAAGDLDALTSSTRWKALRWIEKRPNVSYQLNEQRIISDMQAQIPPPGVHGR